MSSSDSIITFSSTSGEIAAGQVKDITLFLNRSKLTKGTYHVLVYLSINNKFNHIIEVNIEHFEEEKLKLYCNIVDAEYNKVNDILVFVSDTPKNLNIYYTKTGNLEIIPLIYSPTCVSVSPNGEIAAVGHEAHVSYIDLNQKIVMKNIDVPCNIFDIVVDNNRWIYFIPKGPTVDHVIYSINVDSSKFIKSDYDSYFIDAKMKLHPSLTTLYILSTNVGFPYFLHIARIQDGAVSLVVNRQIDFNDFPGNEFWFTHNGNKVFISGKEIVSNEGYSYINLENSNQGILWLDYSEVKNKLYLIIGESSYDEFSDRYMSNRYSNLYIYNATSLTSITNVSLEGFLDVNTTSKKGIYFDPLPYYVFSNSSGDKVYVITKASIPGKSIWGIETITIE